MADASALIRPLIAQSQSQASCSREPAARSHCVGSVLHCIVHSPAAQGATTALSLPQVPASLAAWSETGCRCGAKFRPAWQVWGLSISQQETLSEQVSAAPGSPRLQHGLGQRSREQDAAAAEGCRLALPNRYDELAWSFLSFAILNRKEPYIEAASDHRLLCGGRRRGYVSKKVRIVRRSIDDDVESWPDQHVIPPEPVDDGQGLRQSSSGTMQVSVLEALPKTAQLSAPAEMTRCSCHCRHARKLVRMVCPHIRHARNV